MRNGVESRNGIYEGTLLHTYIHTYIHRILFNHASHTQHNNCTYVPIVNLQIGRNSNIYTTELYLIYLEMAFSNNRRSQKHGGPSDLFS